MPRRPPRLCNHAGCGAFSEADEAYCTHHLQQRKKEHWAASDKRRGSARERGYTADWERARETHLQNEPFCRECYEQLGKLVAAAVVDHKVAHKGDKTLFWDRSNWQSLCTYHHNRKTAREDGGFANATHPDWLTPSQIPLTIVCGPALAGKSTYVRKHARPGDFIICLDQIASRIAGTSEHEWPDSVLAQALHQRNDELRALTDPAIKRRHKAAWMIISAPSSKWRRWWRERLQPQDVVVLEVPKATCILRIDADPARREKAALYEQLISRWWSSYISLPEDIKLSGFAL